MGGPDAGTDINCEILPAGIGATGMNDDRPRYETAAGFFLV